MKKTDKIFLNSEQVSEYLSIPLRTVQHLTKQGKIKAIRIGRKWRFKRIDIDQYFNVGIDFSKEPTRRPNNFVEQRTYPRINCSIQFDVQVIIPQKKEIYAQARIINISEGGVFVENYNNEKDFFNIKNDDPIALNFNLVNNDKIELDGRVVRINQEGIAIRFREIDPNKRKLIKQYVG